MSPHQPQGYKRRRTKPAVLLRAPLPYILTVCRSLTCFLPGCHVRMNCGSPFQPIHDVVSRPMHCVFVCISCPRLQSVFAHHMFRFPIRTCVGWNSPRIVACPLFPHTPDRPLADSRFMIRPCHCIPADKVLNEFYIVSCSVVC